MVKGQCFCGAVSFEIEGPLTPGSLCHCSQCRRLHGAPGAYTSAPASAYRISGEESLKWFATSARAEQSFCRTCGSKLFWREIGDKDLDATLGTLDSPTGITLGRHIFTRHQGDYYEIDHDGVPRYADSSRGKEPVGVEAPPQAGPKKQAHSGACQCGAVTYRVSGSMRDVVNCHCAQCRRIHGHAPGYSAARKSEMTVEGGDNITWYQSSEEAARGFCKSCGSSLFWRPEGRETVSVTAGTLHTPTGMKTVRHIFAADKGDYYTIADGVKQDPGTMSGNPVTF